MTLRKTASFVGALFLTAMVASLMGGLAFVEPALTAPDRLAAVAEQQNQVVVGILLEIVNGICVVLIGVLMYPIFKRNNETAAVGYLALRIIEAVFCCAIVIAPLALIGLGETYLASGADPAAAQAVGAIAVAERNAIANLLIPVFLCLGAYILYGQMARHKFLPRFIALWGLVATTLILALNLLLTFGVHVPTGLAMVFALPMITNEIFLGIWLLAKGFNALPDAK